MIKEDMSLEDISRFTTLPIDELEELKFMCSGFEEIREEGRKESQREIAIRMIKEDMSLEDISRLTALPIDVLEELKKQFV